MNEWFVNNFIESIMVLGIALLIVEVLVLGFATFFLFFVGLAAITTSILMWIGIVDQSWLQAIASMALFTSIYAILLWKKLKALQNQTSHKRAQNDLNDAVFTLDADVSENPAIPVYQKYSGVSWQLLSSSPLKAGTQVKIVRADVGKLVIAPAE